MVALVEVAAEIFWQPLLNAYLDMAAFGSQTAAIYLSFMQLCATLLSQET